MFMTLKTYQVNSATENPCVVSILKICICYIINEVITTTEESHVIGCLQIQPNKLPGEFQ